MPPEALRQGCKDIAYQLMHNVKDIEASVGVQAGLRGGASAGSGEAAGLAPHTPGRLPAH